MEQTALFLEVQRGSRQLYPMMNIKKLLILQLKSVVEKFQLLQAQALTLPQKQLNFQKEEKTLKNKEILQNTISEFEELVKKIKQKNIKVEIFEDREEVITTDSIFPNNWISLHKDGKIYLW